MFNNGIHADKTNFTPHVPVSVTGGDYEKFYLSGMFKPNATVRADNAECYISGGRFGEVAGAGQEQVSGNVTWKIDCADISHFYGGGINATKPVTGDISVTINHSHVGEYCGGPKFGDMSAGRTVTTHAIGCTFGTYFGAGYGGTSYNRVRKQNQTNSPNYDFNGWATSGNDAIGYSRGYYTSSGIASNFEYELFAYAGFADNNNVGRFYVNYASLSLATTRNVVSDLSDCTLTGNFYGGGNLGKVDGNITSTLTACHVMGNVFGAGFSASVPTVEVMKQANFEVAPYYNGEIGAYTIGLPPATETYTWSQLGSNASPFTEDENGKWIYTNQDLSSLGTVTGDVTLSIAGTTHIMGDVYGGGALANSNTNLYRSQASTSATTTVNLKGGTIEGNVYGGGLGQKSGFFGATTDVEALVGNTLVKLNENTATDNCVVLGNIFGCNRG